MNDTAALPYMKFYPQDWRADEKLRLCSLAARGLWMEMIALMHRSERYGQLLIGGRVPTPAQLAVQVGARPREVSALLDELEAAEVFSRAAGGAIYSRRMIRDAKRTRLARRNGHAGGNPILRNQSENPASDKGELKGQLKGELKGGLKGELKGELKGGLKAHARDSRIQRPETRVQNIDRPDGPSPAAAAGDCKILFDLGVSLLTASGSTEAKARALVGKWRRDHGDAAVSEALMAARDKTEPVAWIEARLRGRAEADDALYRSIEHRYGRGRPPAAADEAEA